MAQKATVGRTPTAGEQAEASAAMMKAQAQVQAAETRLRGAKKAADRTAAQKLVQEATAAKKEAEQKYGWIYDWQKNQPKANQTLGTLGLSGDKSAASRDASPSASSGGTLGVQSTPAATTANAPAASQPAAPATRKHVVKKGESLSLIAKQYYGNVRQWKKIYEANKQVVGSNPDLIQVGQELVIPE